jgi:methyl-accepting chemotaxis protein
VRFTVRNKLFAGFGVVVALIVVLGVVAVSKLGTMNRDAGSLGGAVHSVQLVGDMGKTMNEYRKNQLLYVLSDTPAGHADVGPKLVDGRKAMQADLAEYRAHEVSNEQDKQLLDSFAAHWKAYTAGDAEFVAHANAHDEQAAFAVINEGTVNDAWDALKADLAAWEKLNVDGAKADEATAASSYSSARALTLVLIALAILVAAAIAFFVSRVITRGVGQALRAARGIAEGDVEQTVAIRSNDELGELGTAFGSMIEYLKGMAGAADRMAGGDLTVAIEPKSERDTLGTSFARMGDSMRRMIGEVSTAARTMAASSQQMASTSEEAGRAVGEIASAVTDVATGAERQVRLVEQARRSTEETGEAAEQAWAFAEEGVAASARATEAMESLRASTEGITAAIRSLSAKSEQIGGIVETITGIAGQTNLLALNAAIEAARAGEQGRGFAVVAEEVRKLAEESQQAAATISGLVDEIQAETERTVTVVEQGVQQTAESSETVEAARDAFSRIGTAVQGMRERIDQIVEATGDVAAVAAQSSASTEQVSASTQETSASAEEIAASAQELATTAEELHRLVAQFRVSA